VFKQTISACSCFNLGRVEQLQVAFATVPPKEYGCVTVRIALAFAYLGAVTYLAREFATLFGCALGLNDAVTGMSFVAVGISFPDILSSVQVARELPNADAALGGIAGTHLEAMCVALEYTFSPVWMVGCI
jgi:Ca2+/Na+ antiporter